MRIRTLIDKEWAEVFKNKMVLFTVAFMPLIFVLIPLLQLGLMRDLPASELNDAPPGVLAACAGQALTPAECMQGYMVGSFMVLFLLVPVMVPVTIASYSIVGEKTTRSLEPLLATPTSTTEIILGKGLAAVLPAMIATWLSFGLFLFAAQFLTASPAVYARIADPLWLVGMLVVAPLLTVLSVTIAIVVSSRVNDPRAAEQIGAMLVLPVMLLVFGNLLGLFTLNVLTMLVFGAVLAVVDAVLVWVAVKLFQRETILTRWK